MCCCTATRGDLQDSKQLTSLLPWHASARTEERERGWGERGGGLVFIACWWDSVRSWHGGTRGGDRGGAAEKSRCSWLNGASTFRVSCWRSVASETVVNTSWPMQGGGRGLTHWEMGLPKKLHPPFFYTLLRYGGVEGIQVKDGDRNCKKQRGSFERAANFTCENLLTSQEECCSARESSCITFSVSPEGAFYGLGN